MKHRTKKQHHTQNKGNWLPWLLVAAIWVAAGIIALNIHILPQWEASKPWSPPTSQESPRPTPEQHAVTKAELASMDGKNGRACYVAVKGSVYEMPESETWRNGVHTDSEGQVSCGRDVTAEMAQSPHGDPVLSEIVVVGPLVP